MNLEQGNIYHLYNQGNNRDMIFFQMANYLYFLKKTEQHICPFADVLAWCLMPNHFHLIIAVRAQEQSDWVTPGHPVTTSDQYQLNSSIATMLRSYTRAINIQQHRTGSLFREGTKAVWLGSIEGEKLKHRNHIGEVAVHNSDEEYLQTCFKYIHNNPVNDGIANQVTDWEFSSARDIAGIRNETLINKKLIEELGLQLEKRLGQGE
jgi:putative transposase